MSVELALAVALVVVCGLWWRDKRQMAEDIGHCVTALFDHNQQFREQQKELEALRSDIKDLRRAKPLVTIEEDEEGNERTVFNCF